jgi:hypothetical protein
MNNRGQFSVIAALLVAVVLVAAVTATYSSMQFGTSQEQPQILSAIDETNLGLKELLGFTVGYYGSVLKVTGNSTYAQQLATNYLNSGLQNMGDVHPEWNANFNLTSLTLKASWFSNQSYSKGNITVNYDLAGLGIYGLSYSTTTRLDVRVLGAISQNQTQLVILRDENEPLINLGKNNLKFYQYNYQSFTWNLTEPANIASYANGTYILDLPAGIQSNAYVVEVSDTRGLMVLASSFTQFTSAVTWNSTAFRMEPHYVETNQDVLGTQGNFTAQQSGPDNINDTITEQPYGLGAFNYPPLSLNLLGSTTISQSSGNITTDTINNDGNYLQLHSYPSAFSGNGTFGCSTKGGTQSSSLNRMLGSSFTTVNGGQVQSISVYLYSSDNKNHNAKAAIYQASDRSIVGSSSEKTVVPGDNGWVTFTFSDPKPLLNANTNYILVAWADNNHVYTYYDTGTTNQGYIDSTHTYSGGFPTTDTSLNTDNPSTKEYSINCTYASASQYTAQAEFAGTSDSINWQQLTWAVDSAVTAGTANYTLQLYNYTANQYPLSGDGYLSTALNTTGSLQNQTITANPTNYRNSTTGWKLLVTAQNISAAQFDLKIDMVRFTSQFTNYALDLREQWLTVNTSYVRQDLCIKTGALGAEPLLVQVLHGGQWVTLDTLKPNFFNNISVTQYIGSSNFTIRFVGGNDLTDPTPDSWDIDCVYLKDEPDVSYLINRQQSTFTIELLQNGTMRWLGQNMQVTTQTIAVPPIPVKAIHVNETINGVNQEVPFQIEDWASNYQIPLGLTSNTTVFGNRQMIVFLLNSAVTDFTVWWDGSDAATQTAMAYTNRYFTADNPTTTPPNPQTLTNGNITLQFISGAVKSTVVGTGTYSTATFMRINNKLSSYGGGTSFVIHHGIVRDVIQEEAEFGGGITNCPNVYANVIITLPANATYYTYQLRLMFISSTQARSISELCPIQLAPYPTGIQTQTENGTLAGFPLVDNGTATFSNLAGPSNWAPHRFSQFIQDTTSKGAGIMYTDIQNQRLYAFDSFSGSTSKGSLRASSGLLELLPVSQAQVQFTYAYDVTWAGAVATFDGSTPVCSFYDGTTPMGLWILAEYPPTLTVTAKA